MACDLGFQELASHNPCIADLEQQGFHVDLVGGYLVIYGLPYLDDKAALQYGDLFSSLDLDGVVIDPPKDHQVYFRGGQPHNAADSPIRLGGGENRITISGNITADRSFSFKIKDKYNQMRAYESFEEKVTTYIDAITGPAMALFPEATPLRGIETKALEQGSSLRYPDSMSARYDLNDIAFKLKGKSVAIVGLGGTGSYILDFLSKSHLDKIHIFDSDKIHVHSIFRIPGFIRRAIGQKKVGALAGHFGELHSGIVPHEYRIDQNNLDLLLAVNFVFVSVDDPESRGLITKYCADNALPFADCGMGLNRSLNGLNGVVRVTGVDSRSYKDTVSTPYLPTSKAADDEYRKRPQIAELNALNASLAVIRFKQYFGIYDLIDDFSSTSFETCSFDSDRVGYRS